MEPTRFDISVEIHELGVERAGRFILAGVSFKLARGEALVLRGPNGAGKTSLLRAVAGFSRVREGKIAFSDQHGIFDREDIAATHMHYLGHENGVSAKLTVIENIAFWKHLLNTNGAEEPAHVIECVGLTHMTHERARRLSAGQKRRLALARLLIAPRAVWLMDEPASALGAAGQDLLRRLCDDHRKAGGIIILTSHEGFSLPDARGLQLAPGTAAA